MKRTGQVTVFLLCVLFSVSAAYNVFSDNYAIEQDAKGVACRDEGEKCRAQVTRMERTPFAQSFEITTSKREVGVKCVRSLIMVGDYACTLR